MKNPPLFFQNIHRYNNLTQKQKSPNHNFFSVPSRPRVPKLPNDHPHDSINQLPTRMNVLARRDDQLSSVFFTSRRRKSHGLSAATPQPSTLTLTGTTSEELSAKHVKKRFTVSEVKKKKKRIKLLSSPQQKLLSFLPKYETSPVITAMNSTRTHKRD